jgi:hypothetical protein
MTRAWDESTFQLPGVAQIQRQLNVGVVQKEIDRRACHATVRTEDQDIAHVDQPSLRPRKTLA